MKLAIGLCIMTLMPGTAAAQTPAIAAVVNVASGIKSPLPSSGIAQGAILLIVGSNLGPAALAVDNRPFTNTRLLGTSANVTVGGVTVGVLMYYTSANQVAGLLPSNAPVGTGTITLSYNGASSAPTPITVVQNNLGIFTVTSDGTGPAIVTYPDYSLVSPSRAANCGGPNTTCGAANPGDVLILWATGLGPVSTPDSSGPQPGNMPAIPLKLWLGGVQATVTYQGRSGCCIGLDQVVFTIPNNVPVGCAVPLAVQINDQISNYTALPVARDSRTCTPTAPYITAGGLTKLTSGSPLTFGEVQLQRRSTSGGTYEDRGQAEFAKVSLPAGFTPFAATLIDTQPAGTCIAANTVDLGGNPPFTFFAAPDAGPSLTVSGPGGSRTLLKQAGPETTRYFTVLGPGDYLTNGAFTISGPGGADVGAFTTAIDLTAPPVWTNQSSLSTVNRANGLTVNWTGGSPNTEVLLYGSSAGDKNSFGASFACSAPATAGTLTVPPSVLQVLPAGTNGQLRFSLDATTSTYIASGLDVGFVTSNRETARIAVTFQ